MPTPIKWVPDLFSGQREEQRPSIDFSFLSDRMQNLPARRNVTASNADASALYEIWLNGEKTGEYTYKVSEAVSRKDVINLKTKGFVTGSSGEVSITPKGRTVITTISLGEANRFLRERKDKSYSEILASMSKKGKKGYRMASTGEGSPKFLANNSNSLDLRKT